VGGVVLKYLQAQNLFALLMLVMLFALVLFLFPWLVWYFPPSCHVRVGAWSTKLIHNLEVNFFSHFFGFNKFVLFGLLMFVL
jgi:hypothetical protein